MHFGAVEVIVIAVVIFILFGYKKLPAAMKSLKEGLSIFKKENKDDSVKTEGNSNNEG